MSLLFKVHWIPHTTSSVKTNNHLYTGSRIQRVRLQRTPDYYKDVRYNRTASRTWSTAPKFIVYSQFCPIHVVGEFVITVPVVRLSITNPRLRAVSHGGYSSCVTGNPTVKHRGSCLHPDSRHNITQWGEGGSLGEIRYNACRLEVGAVFRHMS